MAHYNEFGKEVLKQQGSIQGVKTLGAAIGMPDAEDKKNVAKIIKNYERKYPGAIKVARDYGRLQLFESRLTRHEAGKFTSKDYKNKSMVDNLAGRTYDMELPAGLGQKLEEYMPTIFREREHYRWFKRNFPQLLLLEPHEL